MSTTGTACRRLTMVFGTLALAVATSATAGRGGHSALEAQLGVRFAAPLAASPVIGQALEATIVDPAKLNKLGFSGLKRGDKVKLTPLEGEGRFLLQHLRTSQKRNLLLSQEGLVRPDQQALR